jgi:cyclohexyl-isocyanide hydratase
MSAHTETAATEGAGDDQVEIGVIVFDGCDELDGIGPINVFHALNSVRPFVAPFPATCVHLVGERAGEGQTVQSGNGIVLTPSTSYADCPPLDVVVVAGGTGEREDGSPGGRLAEMRNPATLAFIQAQAARGAVVASVCTGSFVLAGAGLLDGRRANTHWLSRQELVDHMASRGADFELVCERVVDDGDVLTCGGVSSGIDLAIHISGRLFGDEVGQAVALAVEHRTPAPADVAALPV